MAASMHPHARTHAAPAPVSQIIATDDFDVETTMRLIEPHLNLDETDGGFVAAVIADADGDAAAAAAPHPRLTQIIRHRMVMRRFLYMNGKEKKRIYFIRN